MHLETRQRRRTRAERAQRRHCRVHARTHNGWMEGMGEVDSKYGSYFFGQESLAHYYGNTVRQLFLGATTVMLLGAPFYVDVFRVQMPFIVLGAIVLVMLAALTSPQSRSVMMANAVAAGAGATLYEFWALAGF